MTRQPVHPTPLVMVQLSADLLRESDTHPEAVGTYNDPLLDDLASAVAHSPRSASAVREALATCLAVMEVPPQLNCLAEALRLLQNLVPLFLTARRHSRSAVRSFTSMLQASARELARHPARTRLKDRPPYQEAPFFRFHLDAWVATRAAHDFYALWIVLLHRGLRKVWNPRGNFETWLDYLESARLFMTCMPHDALPRPLPSPQKHLTTYLRAFHRGYRRSPYAKRLRTGTIFRAHEGRIKRILEGKQFQPCPHSGPDLRRPDRAYSGLLQDAPDRRYEFGAITITPIVAAVQPATDDPGFSAADDDEPLLLDLLERETGPDGAVVRRPPRLPGRYRHLYVRHNFDFWWQLEACHLAGWRALYGTAEVLSSVEPGGLGEGLYLLLLGFLGQPDDAVARMRVASYASDAPLSPDELYIDPDRWWIFRHFSPVSSISPHAGTWTPCVMVPLPLPLVPLAARYWKTLTQLTGEPPDFFFPHLATGSGLVENLARLLPSAAPNEEALRTPRKLGDAFPRTLGHGHGLDAVATYLVSGRGHFRAQVQAHYTSIAAHDLADCYGRSTESLHAHIRASLPSGVGWWSQHDGATAPASPNSVIFGSPLGDSIDRFTIAVARLAERILNTQGSEDPSDLIVHHNAYTAYATLLLLALGLRPRNDAWGYRVDLFARGLNYLPVADKQSKKYHEERMLPVPTTGSEVVCSLARGRPRLAERLAEAWGTEAASQLTSALLQPLDPGTGLPRPFALRELQSILVAMDILDFTNVPLNLGRHLLRTYLRNLRLADDLIDLALGHRRGGREALAFHAATRYGAALETLRELLTIYLDDELGFAPLAYLPAP